MKRLLIASAVLSLLGSAAYAQQSQTAPATPTSQQPPVPAPTNPALTQSGAAETSPPTPSNAPAGSSPETSVAATPSSTLATSSPTASVVGDLAQANPPPANGSYPICKTHNQDRCVVASQMKRTSVAKQTTIAKTSAGA